ncbi:hypothetical protein GGR53DRAFT_532329 [Hypoxylon sp. FL1150]|nr:hypothetical protein GGR53DRAFT_532329 [Hypoxylon sp. FL1150]
MFYRSTRWHLHKLRISIGYLCDIRHTTYDIRFSPPTIPFEENLTFKEYEYRAEVKALLARVAQAAGDGGGALSTGGLTLIIGGVQGPEHDDLRRHSATPRDIDFKEAAVAFSVGVAGLDVGTKVENFVEGVTSTDAMGSHLPDGAIKRTRLTVDPSTGVKGAGGQIEQDVAAAVAVADKMAYHVGMVQAQIIEEQLDSEGV